MIHSHLKFLFFLHNEVPNGVLNGHKLSCRYLNNKSDLHYT